MADHWRSPRDPIPEFERGSSLLFLFVVLLPIALVGGLCLAYAALVIEPIQYEQRVEAEAFKSH
jgi:hypothetical protein